MINYFIYARKSTDEEDRQMLLIGLQLRELRNLKQRESVQC